MALASITAPAGNSLLIWPVNPTIRHDEQATALWIENQGRTTAHLQLRVFEWHQTDGEDTYRPQQAVVGSPPMTRIAPGQRQLVRLTRTAEAAPGAGELAYRIVVDEIPVQPVEETPAGTPVGVRFQFRYSIPLFVNGDAADQEAPQLAWELERRDGQVFLLVHNRGLRHARLTGLGFRRPGGAHVPLEDVQLGYVLAGSFARWPLADAAQTDGTLEAHIEDHQRLHVIPPMRGTAR
ncbi:molecular chaperone [Luteimonas sp. S4-F44]|uniref:fimbrial biogenesis chaperone n=1 Tax=Luteimonas sp. S4-F44 TaxID=2925842 RepID=UPI001F52BE43|nr:molecular chaperone [Luteimonas sp. S4-F44]UNK41423.1 molecular chaperone [Luteimonas sp. S4-F44]